MRNMPQNIYLFFLNITGSKCLYAIENRCLKWYKGMLTRKALFLRTSASSFTGNGGNSSILMWGTLHARNMILSMKPYVNREMSGATYAGIGGSYGNFNALDNPWRRRALTSSLEGRNGRGDKRGTSTPDIVRQTKRILENSPVSRWKRWLSVVMKGQISRGKYTAKFRRRRIAACELHVSRTSGRENSPTAHKPPI